MNPDRQRTFEKAKEEHGFGLAALMFWPELDQDNLTTPQWEEIYRTAAEGIESKEVAFEKILGKATTFAQVHNLMLTSALNLAKQERVVAKMRGMAKTPWEFVVVWIASSPSEKPLVEEELREIKADAREWKSALIAAGEGTPPKAICFGKLQELMARVA